MKQIPLILLVSLLSLTCNAQEKKGHDHKHDHNHNHDHGKKTRKRKPFVINKLIPSETVRLADIGYKNVGETQLTLDIYKPNKTVKDAPLVVWIHGGAWMRGSKEAFIQKNNRLVNTLLKEGYIIASINYRLSGEATFPKPVQDCNDAINYLWKHSKDYGFNKHKIVLMGRSAGGHLAALVAASNTHNVSDFFTKPSRPKFKVKALVDFFGPSDLTTLKVNKARDPKRSPTARFLGDVPTNKPELAKKASPVTYINKHTPPTILLHGLNDRKVQSDQSKDFKERLDAVNVINELYIVENAKHGDRIFDSEKYVTLVLNFLRTQCPVK